MQDGRCSSSNYHCKKIQDFKLLSASHLYPPAPALTLASSPLASPIKLLAPTSSKRPHRPHYSDTLRPLYDKRVESRIKIIHLVSLKSTMFSSVLTQPVTTGVSTIRPEVSNQRCPTNQSGTRAHEAMVRARGLGTSTSPAPFHLPFDWSRTIFSALWTPATNKSDHCHPPLVPPYLQMRKTKRSRRWFPPHSQIHSPESKTAKQEMNR